MTDLLVANRNNTLRQKLALSQLNPHLIFNALTAMQHFVMLDDKFKAQHYLSQLSQFIRQVLQDARHVRVSISQEKARLERYLELEQVRFDQRFNFRIEADGNHRSIPSMLLFPFVEEALYQRVLSMPESSEMPLLRITFEVDFENTIISIMDNTPFKNTNNKHAGVQLAEEQIDALNQGRVQRIKLVRDHDETMNRVMIHIPHSLFQ